MKLPYNANGENTDRAAYFVVSSCCIPENPYTAAQRFLEANDLPLSYLDEVVRFIEKNTAGATIGSSTQFSDPYTGP